MPQNPLKKQIQLKVRFNECDPLQIVWHGNYFKYFEEAREAFCQIHKFSYSHVQQRGLATPMVKTSCEHLLPLRYGDTFIVEAEFIPSPAAKIIFNYKIFKDKNLVCSAQSVQVFINEKGEMQLNTPAFFLDWKQKMGI